MPPSSPRRHRIRVGVDVVSVARVRRLVDGNEDLLDEVWSPAEQRRSLSPPSMRDRRLAVRFAAKEAVLKAFGTGLASRMRWADVEVVDEPGGRPRVALHGEVAELAARRGLAELDVSVAQAGDVALAHAVTIWEDRDAVPSH